MKKILAFLGAVLIFICSVGLNVSAYGENRISDVFGNATAQCDVNIDGSFDIRDLIRFKKYIAGMDVAINLNITGIQGDSAANAMIILKKQLLEVG